MAAPRTALVRLSQNRRTGVLHARITNRTSRVTRTVAKASLNKMMEVVRRALLAPTFLWEGQHALVATLAGHNLHPGSLPATSAARASIALPTERPAMLATKATTQLRGTPPGALSAKLGNTVLLAAPAANFAQLANTRRKATQTASSVRKGNIKHGPAKIPASTARVGGTKAAPTFRRVRTAQQANGAYDPCPRASKNANRVRPGSSRKVALLHARLVLLAVCSQTQTEVSAASAAAGSTCPNRDRKRAQHATPGNTPQRGRAIVQHAVQVHTALLPMTPTLPRHNA
jgi:hypothetical protein